jgi:formate/nitrite transporter FocA (FNT family)
METFFVGFYCSALAFLLLLGMNISLLFFFVLGFAKHYLGYLLGIHDVYCNQGRACLQRNSTSSTNKQKYKATNKHLFLESILEGMWFLIIGSVLMMSTGEIKHKKNTLLFFVFIFLAGGFTHLLAEFVGIHTYFCGNNCLASE